MLSETLQPSQEEAHVKLPVPSGRAHTFATIMNYSFMRPRFPLTAASIETKLQRRQCTYRPRFCRIPVRLLGRMAWSVAQNSPPIEVDKRHHSGIAAEAGKAAHLTELRQEKDERLEEVTKGIIAARLNVRNQKAAVLQFLMNYFELCV